MTNIIASCHDVLVQKYANLHVLSILKCMSHEDVLGLECSYDTMLAQTMSRLQGDTIMKADLTDRLEICTTYWYPNLERSLLPEEFEQENLIPAN